MRLVKEYLHVDKGSIYEMQQEGDLKGLDGLSLTDVEADHLISALYEVEFEIDVDTEQIVSVNGKNLLDAPSWAQTLLDTVKRLIPYKCVDPSSRVERLVESVHRLLDFIADKYGDVAAVEDFTCPHHHKLADMIGWTRRVENDENDTV